MVSKYDFEPNGATWFRRTQAETNQAGGFTSRYRRDWDEDAKADSPDTVAGTPGSAASTRADANWAEANWKCCAASVDIVFLAIIRGRSAQRNPLRPLVTAVNGGATPQPFEIEYAAESSDIF